jgi:hypothetical protein
LTTLGESGVVGEGELLVVPPRTAHSGWALLDSEYDVLMFDLRNFTDFAVFFDKTVDLTTQKVYNVS